MEWLEPKIETRIEEITEFCDESSNDLFMKLNEIICVLNQQTPKSYADLVTDFESMFILKSKHYAEISYRSGLKDGISLGASVR